MELTELHAKFELIIYNGLVRGVNTEKYINKYIHTYIHKANHFNTGPTTSSRHSKKYKITTCASGNAIGVTISEVNWDQ